MQRLYSARITFAIREQHEPTENAFSVVDCLDITSDGKELWVTQRFLRRVAVVDLTQMKMVASIAVGKSPHGVFILDGPAPETADKLRK